MAEFNVHKWFKNQYLKEAGIFEEEKFPMPSPSVFFAIHKILADLLDEKAVEAGDRMSYFSAEFPLSSYFESYMRKQLEGTLLSEAPGSTLNLSQADMDKLHKDGKLEIDGHKLLFNVNESLDIDFDDEKDVKDETSFYDPVHEAESSNIEKIDFAFVDGTTQFYGAYIYKDGGKPVGAGLPNTWNEKLRSTREVQDFLTSLGIDIEFNYYNLPEISKALAAKGIKAEDSEFDVS